MMKIILLSVMMTPVLLWPQTPPQTVPADVTKIIRVHNTRPEKLAEMARAGTPVTIRANDALKAIVIKGKPADVATVEQTIRELDTASMAMASRNVELMVYIVSGSNAVATTSAPAEKLAALTPVIKQLRAIFSYNDYQLLSTMLLRSGEGSKTSSNGLLKALQNAPGLPPSDYSIQYDSATVSPEEKSPTIHLEHFRFDTRIAVPTGLPGSTTQFQIRPVGILTDVDLREGQKVVVGNSNIENADSALFVILSAKLVP